jgi:hypothetical protein
LRPDAVVFDQFKKKIQSFSCDSCRETSIVILLQFSMLLEVGNNNRHDDALEKTQGNSREILLIEVMEFSSFLLGFISLSG